MFASLSQGGMVEFTWGLTGSSTSTKSHETSLNVMATSRKICRHQSLGAKANRKIPLRNIIELFWIGPHYAALHVELLLCETYFMFQWTCVCCVLVSTLLIKFMKKLSLSTKRNIIWEYPFLSLSDGLIADRYFSHHFKSRCRKSAASKFHDCQLQKWD